MKFQFITASASGTARASKGRARLLRFVTGVTAASESLEVEGETEVAERSWSMPWLVTQRSRIAALAAARGTLEGIVQVSLSAEQAVACATGANDTVTGTPAPSTAELELLAAAVVLLAASVVVVAGRAVVTTAAEVVRGRVVDWAEMEGRREISERRKRSGRKVRPDTVVVFMLVSELTSMRVGKQWMA